MTTIPKKITISWLKEAYASKKLTPWELMREIVKRAGEEKQRNIWILPPVEEFLSPYLSYLETMPEDLPLWGIPFAIKDNIDLAGVPTTAACPDYAYVPKRSAAVVQKLIDAGAIPVGKTNLDQFATGLVGTRSPYGECHNALNEELISGGSSSGSAVSVACGMAAFALGTDTAGSGRVPAMLNGLVGFKPALGAWSTRGVVPACASLDCVTVFSNTLEDAEAVNEEAMGYDSDCIWSRQYDAVKKNIPKKVFLPETKPTFFGDYKEIMEKKWDTAVARVRSLGIPCEEIDYQMFYDAARILYDGSYVAERWADLGDFVTRHENSVFPVTKKILMSGAAPDKTATGLFGDLHALQAYRHKAAEILRDAVMIMPTTGGTFTRDQVREDPVETNSLMGLYTNHCNLLDFVACAVPENVNDTEIPFGITIFALSQNTGLVLKSAEEFLAQ
ncbi:MAG: allophanate hydrolase [Lachnospiraceae bacterium]|nr:allophanate hydrolase [Lachnospiraceae bacterium]